MESTEQRWMWARRDRESARNGTGDARHQAPRGGTRPMFASAPRSADGTEWVRDAITRTYK